MKSENLKAAHDLYERIHPLKVARAALSKDGFTVTVKGVDFEGSPVTVELDPVIKVYLLNGLNSMISQAEREIEKL